MDIDKAIKKRASIKKFSDKKIKIDKILDLIESANLAPSPGNLPIINYILVDKKEIINKISEACRQPFISKAPYIIILCSNNKQVKTMYDKRADKYTKQHIGAAIENILLKITDLKLASTWVGAFSEEIIKNTLKIPDETEVEAVIPVAKPHKTDKTKQKPKPGLEKRLFFNKWKQDEYRPHEKIKQTRQ